MLLSRRKFINTSLLAGTGLALLRPAEAQVEEVAVWVGEELLKGAIAYVGGLALGSALGNATISDVQAWITAAVAELEAFVSAELQKQLDQKVLDQLQADLYGAKQNLGEYASLAPGNRTANRFLIEQADIHTASLVPLSQKYDQAFYISTTAMAYRFFALYALYDIDKDHGHITSLKDMVDEYLTRAVEIRGAILQRLSPGVRITVACQDYIAPIHNPGDPFQPPPDEGTICNVVFDGRQVFSDNEDSHDQASALAQNYVNQNLAANVQAQMTFFTDHSILALQLVVDGYHKMCEKIGINYTAPSQLQLQTTYHTTTISRPVVMPGAFVPKQE